MLYPTLLVLLLLCFVVSCNHQDTTTNSNKTTATIAQSKINDMHNCPDRELPK